MDELKSTGLKATVPRQKILEIFQKGMQRHMTAEDVYKQLLKDNADIGLATVYRVLTQFEQAGLLSRNHFESGKAVYELNEGQHHDHMVCQTAARWKSFTMPKLKSASTMWPWPKALSLPTTPSACMPIAHATRALIGNGTKPQAL